MMECNIFNSVKSPIGTILIVPDSHATKHKYNKFIQYMNHHRYIVCIAKNKQEFAIIADQMRIPIILCAYGDGAYSVKRILANKLRDMAGICAIGIAHKLNITQPNTPTLMIHGRCGIFRTGLLQRLMPYRRYSISEICNNTVLFYPQIRNSILSQCDNTDMHREIRIFCDSLINNYR